MDKKSNVFLQEIDLILFLGSVIIGMIFGFTESFLFIQYTFSILIAMSVVFVIFILIVSAYTSIFEKRNNLNEIQQMLGVIKTKEGNLTRPKIDLSRSVFSEDNLEFSDKSRRW